MLYEGKTVVLYSSSKHFTIANTRTNTMQNEKKKPYLAIPHEVLCSDAVTNVSTGVVLKWNLQERLFYCWMLAEYTAFKNLGGTMHHNMDVIAGRLGVTAKSIERYVKTFTEFGLIVKNKVTYKAGVCSNNYVVYDVCNSSSWVLSNTLLEKDTSMRELLGGKRVLPKQSQNKIVKKHTEEYDPYVPF